MNTIQGDLIALALAGRFDVIVHGCNCRHAMDAGIAKQIKAAFPEAYTADLATPKGAGKLGTISTAEIERGGVRFTVANAYTQDHWQGAGVLADYAAIRAAFGRRSGPITIRATTPTSSSSPKPKSNINQALSSSSFLCSMTSSFFAL